MSLISSFWTINKSMLTDLLAKSKPVEIKVGKKPLLPFVKQKTKVIYPWLDFLTENAQEEKSYEYSGMIMIDYNLMLSEAAKSLFDLSIHEASQFSEYCGGSSAIINYEYAQTIITHIKNTSFSERDVVQFYNKNQTPGESRFNLKEILDAGEHVKLWCNSITPEKLGILVIG